MIRVTSIRHCHISDYNAVYLITRSTGSTGEIILRRVKHLSELGPNADLFFDYLKWNKNGELTQEKFDNCFKPVFVNQINNSLDAQKWLDKIATDSKNGSKIALITFAANENLCHRSIIAEMLKARGCNVICDKDVNSKHKRIPVNLSTPENMGKVIRIIDVFEDLLNQKGLTIENEERNEYAKGFDNSIAKLGVIFGNDYYVLEDDIRSAKTVTEIINIFRIFADEKNLNLDDSDFDCMRSDINAIVM